MNYLNIVIIIACLNFNIKSQDAEFTQFYSNPIYLNPAFTGTNICPRISINQRSQWTGLPSVFNTTSFSYDQNFEKIRGGLGLMILSDRLTNSIQNNKISGIYSYEVRISKKIALRTGFEASFWQNKFDQTQLTFVDMIDPLRGFVLPTSNSMINNYENGLDFSAGILAYGENVFFGVSIHHLLEPEQRVFSNNSKLDRKYSLNLGYDIPVTKNNTLSDDKLVISPNIIWKKQGYNEQLNLGIYVERGPYVVGVWYRDNRNYAFLIGAKVGLIKIGYKI
jgi:type IX secretion system PorP/SprF family membrane protein